jgi:hypothetical protein
VAADVIIQVFSKALIRLLSRRIDILKKKKNGCHGDEM